MPVLNDLEAARDALREAVTSASRIVAFTGAGISTEAGIPDFRSPGSLWKRHKPIPFQAFIASREARAEAWRRKFAMDDSYRGAQPATGHRVIAHLVETGRVDRVVTQNIDGLHQLSGIAADLIVELHGNGTYAACLSCGTRHELDDIRPRFEATGEPPDCDGCGGAVKSATISFGQAMPQVALREAHAAARACDLFLAIGSSLVVYPAAAIPLVAKDAGARLVIINLEATGLDDSADLVLRGDIGAIMHPLLEIGAP